MMCQLMTYLRCLETMNINPAQTHTGYQVAIQPVTRNRFVQTKIIKYDQVNIIIQVQSNKEPQKTLTESQEDKM